MISRIKFLKEKSEKRAAKQLAIDLVPTRVLSAPSSPLLQLLPPPPSSHSSLSPSLLSSFPFISSSSSASDSLEPTTSSSSSVGPSFFSSKRNTTSGFYGVDLDSESSRKWRAFIYVPNHSCYDIGLFDDAEAAAHAYDEVAWRVEGAELNFERGRGEEMIEGGGESASHEETDGFARSSSGKLKRTSKFAGVNFNKSKGKWEISVTVPGKKAFRTSFVDEVEAAQNYDNLVSYPDI